MRIKPFAQRDLGDPACLVQLDAALRQIEVKGIAVRPGPLQSAPGLPQVDEVRCRLAFIDPALRFLVSDHLVDAHQGAGEAPVHHLAIGANVQVAGHGRPIPTRPQRADICA